MYNNRKEKVHFHSHSFSKLLQNTTLYDITFMPCSVWSICLISIKQANMSQLVSFKPGTYKVWWVYAVGCVFLFIYGINHMNLMDLSLLWLQETNWPEEGQTSCILIVTDRWIHWQSHWNGEAA